MTRSRSFAWIGLAGCFAWVLAGGCSASSDGDSGGPSGSTAGNAGSGGKAGGPTVIEPDASVNGGHGNDTVNALCGEGVCLPDNASACRGYQPPPVDGVSGQGSGGQAGAGAADSAGAGGQSLDGVGGDVSGEGGTASGGASGAGGDGGGAGGVSGAGGAGGDGGANAVETPGVASYSCQVARQGSFPTRACAIAGTGKVNAPCLSGADCAPSLACVTEGDAGRCLPYCCGVGADCAGGTYCAERALRTGPSGRVEGAAPQVPVCVPTDDCSLEDRYPCPAGSECRCKGDTACMVVRDDGTTTCLKPGSGLQGGACPCAWNHVCSSVTQTCVKLCRTDPATNDCGEQKCQASSELPPNFGVCVGPVK